MKILYIGRKVETITAGCDVINLRNQQLLQDIQGADLEIMYAPAIYSKDFWNCNLQNNIELQNFYHKIQQGGYTHIFFSYSFDGRVVKFVKEHFANIKVIVFFHNIESHHSIDRFRSIKPRIVGKYLSYYLKEWWCCRYADYLITLNKRDSRLLKLLYRRESNLELPSSFRDSYKADPVCEGALVSKDQVSWLFVGVAFWANINGLQWFLDNVLAHIPGRLIVVGTNMDKAVLTNVDTTRVSIYGYVEDLASYYKDADFVIEPIFRGGGMKTKTAEALMYGKTIIGTKEAFEGYDVDQRCMYECNSKREFVQTLNMLAGENDRSKFNKFARELFLSKYTYESSLEKMKKLLEE